MLFKLNPKEFLRRFVTANEKWNFWYTLKTKKHSKHWTSHVKPAPQYLEGVPSAGKGMVNVF